MIRLLNQKKILRLLYRNNQLTKQEIAQMLNISIPTVISNSRELMKQGFLEVAGVAESTGGRKPTIVKFIPTSRYSFGIWVTKEKIRIILTDLNFKIIDEINFNMIDQLYDFRDIIVKVSKYIRDIINNFSISPNKILGIGFSLPGTVDEDKMLLKNVPNFGMKNICFNEFKDYFEFPLYIENEANASAYAEAFLNFNDTKSSLVFISITEGIGTGIIVDGDIYKGFNKRAGEFGHMTIVKNGRECNCGKKGCWELYASKKALLNEYRTAFDDENKNLDDFLEMSKVDKKAQSILNTYIDFLAEGIKNIILTLDPQNIVIGGEIFSYRNLIEKRLMNKIFENNSFYERKDCTITFSSLKENAAILGAALLPVKEMLF